MKIHSRYLEMTRDSHAEQAENSGKSIKKNQNKNRKLREEVKTQFTEEAASADEYMKNVHNHWQTEERQSNKIWVCLLDWS